MPITMLDYKFSILKLSNLAIPFLRFFFLLLLFFFKHQPRIYVGINTTDHISGDELFQPNVFHTSVNLSRYRECKR